MNATKLTFCTW